jgi:hypothetical protein
MNSDTNCKLSPSLAGRFPHMSRDESQASYCSLPTRRSGSQSVSQSVGRDLVVEKAGERICSSLWLVTLSDWVSRVKAVRHVAGDEPHRDASHINTSKQHSPIISSLSTVLLLFVKFLHCALSYNFPRSSFFLITCHQKCQVCSLSVLFNDEKSPHRGQHKSE